MNKENIKSEIVVQDRKINILNINGQEYISSTDLAKYANIEDPSGVIKIGCQIKIHFNFILYRKN